MEGDLQTTEDDLQTMEDDLQTTEDDPPSNQPLLFPSFQNIKIVSLKKKNLVIFRHDSVIFHSL